MGRVRAPRFHVRFAEYAPVARGGSSSSPVPRSVAAFGTARGRGVVPTVAYGIVDPPAAAKGSSFFGARAYAVAAPPSATCRSVSGAGGRDGGASCAAKGLASRGGKGSTGSHFASASEGTAGARADVRVVSPQGSGWATRPGTGGAAAAAAVGRLGAAGSGGRSDAACPWANASVGSASRLAAGLRTSPSASTSCKGR